MKIRLLDEETAGKIAAGEVVVDPAAVVKELVENALDAQSTTIQIHISDGGRSKIQVWDNGSGIDEEDIELAFARHGTSKIQRLEDLDQLHSLGFRGEALASIAAVASVQVKTSSREDGLGFQYQRQGSKSQIKSISWPRGTTILVENLFYNTPARYKHLKKSGEENRKIIRLTQQLALSHPQISFTLNLDGVVVLKTGGNGNLLHVMQSLFGDHGSQQWIQADYWNQPLGLEGFLGSPYETKRNRDFQFVYMNRRIIHEPRINRAIEEAYDDLLMVHQHPSFVLHITLPSSMLDVNIHPGKTKVLVRNESLFLLLLKEGIRKVLRSNVGGKSVTASKAQEQAYFRVREEEWDIRKETPEILIKIQPTPKIPPVVQEEMEVLVHSTLKKDPTSRELEGEDEDLLQVDKRDETTSERHPSLEFMIEQSKVLGTLFSTYIMLERDIETLILIDQHAAHERIVYEKLDQARKGTPLDTQTLIPVTVALSSDRYSFLMENKELFFELGFEFASFGTNQVVIRGVPVLLGQSTDANFLLDILESERLENGALQQRILLAACKRAVKARQKLSDKEVQALLRQWVQCRQPYTCPHGRPIMVTMDQYAVEKLFKRVT